MTKIRPSILGQGSECIVWNLKSEPLTTRSRNLKKAPIREGPKYDKWKMTNLVIGHVGCWLHPSRQFWDCGRWKSDSLWNFSIVGCQFTVNCLLGLLTPWVLSILWQTGDYCGTVMIVRSLDSMSHLIMTSWNARCVKQKKIFNGLMLEWSRAYTQECKMRDSPYRTITATCLKVHPSRHIAVP